MGYSLLKLVSIDEAKECALLMSSCEPWVTLKRSYDDSLKTFLDRSNETYIVKTQESIIGFITVNCQGSLTPYIRSVALLPEYRNKGIGTHLIKSVEKIYSPVSRNIFICVSSFNEKAKKLYLYLGYKIVGELENYIITGQSDGCYANL